jgi:flagellar biosynthetic protein FlhB
MSPYWSQRVRIFWPRRSAQLAEEHNIPIVENPPTARALYAGVKIDQEIPQEHFKAVAEIIGYVFRLKGKLPPGR